MNYLNLFLYFQKNIPAVDVQISVGSHEELYHTMENGVIDLSLNDRRRAFSDAYNNMVLAERTLYIEISTKNPLSKLHGLEIIDLKKNSMHPRHESDQSKGRTGIL